MPTKLKFKPNQVADLERIRELGPAILRRIVDRVREIDPVPLRPQRLLAAAFEILPDQNELADRVIRQAIAIHSLVRQGGLTVDEAFVSIRQAIDLDFSWNEDQKRDWDNVSPVLRELVETAAIRLVSTTIDLSYEYANLFRRARILTDVRPLFNEPGTAIEGSVVSHTLRMRYDSVDGDHSLSIAMDEADIKALVQQCERALIKARTAKAAMLELGIPTAITGESDND